MSVGNDQYTVLLIHSDDADGSTTFVDSGAGANCPHTITAYGDVHHETDQAKFGASAIYFDGSGDSLRCADSGDWFFSGDGTIDFWIRFSSTADQGIIGQFADGGNQWSLIWRSGYGIQFAQNSGGVTIINAMQGSSSGWSVNTWYHVAVVKNGGTMYIFRDGQQVASGTGTVANVSAALTVGIANNWYFGGYLDELRISNGIARWTESFTPPTAPYGISNLPVLAEAVGVGDAYIITGPAKPVFLDAVGVGDSYVITGPAKPVVSEKIGVGDSYVITGPAKPVFSETVGVGDEYEIALLDTVEKTVTLSHALDDEKTVTFVNVLMAEAEKTVTLVNSLMAGDTEKVVTLVNSLAGDTEKVITLTNRLLAEPGLPGSGARVIGKPAHTVTLDGEDITRLVTECSVDMSGGFCLSVSVAMSSNEKWAACRPDIRFGELRIVLTVGEESLSFLLEDRGTSRTQKGISYNVWGRSAHALLGLPFSGIIRDSETSGHVWQIDDTGEDTAAEYITSGEAVAYALTSAHPNAPDVVWEADEFRFAKGTFSASGSPLDIIRSLADVTGAQLHADPDGTLRVIEYQTGGEPVESCNDMDHITVLNESFQVTAGYDAVTVIGYSEDLDTGDPTGDSTDENGESTETEAVDRYIEVDTGDRQALPDVKIPVRLWVYPPDIPSVQAVEADVSCEFVGTPEPKLIAETVALKWGVGHTSRPDTDGETLITGDASLPYAVQEAEYEAYRLDALVSGEKTGQKRVVFYYPDTKDTASFDFTVIDAETGAYPATGIIGSPVEIDPETGEPVTEDYEDPVSASGAWDYCGSYVIETLSEESLSVPNAAFGPVDIEIYQVIVYGKDKPVTVRTSEPGVSSIYKYRRGKDVTEAVSFSDGKGSLSYPLYSAPQSVKIDGEDFPVQWAVGSKNICCQGAGNATATVSYSPSGWVYEAQPNAGLVTFKFIFEIQDCEEKVFDVKGGGDGLILVQRVTGNMTTALGYVHTINVEAS